MTPTDRIPDDEMASTLAKLIGEGHTMSELLYRAEHGLQELDQLRSGVVQWTEHLHAEVIDQAELLGQADREVSQIEEDPGEVYARLNIDPKLDDGQFIEAYRRGVASDE